MKNIHVLPTDKPSSLFLNKVNNKLLSEDIANPYLKKLLPSGTHQNIYISSDEEIKEGDYYISILENEVYKATKETQNIMSVANLIETTTYKHSHFKIILTTDQDLIEDGVQSIDNQFLEWLIENKSCEQVEIEHTYISREFHKPTVKFYKIIYPKEEPKQFCENCKKEISEWGCACGKQVKPKQGTLEEVDEKNLGSIKKINSSSLFKVEELVEITEKAIKDGKGLPSKTLTEVAEHYFILGYEIAKDKNKYSEEEVKVFLKVFLNILFQK